MACSFLKWAFFLLAWALMTPAIVQTAWEMQQPGAWAAIGVPLPELVRPVAITVIFAAAYIVLLIGPVFIIRRVQQDAKRMRSKKS